MKTDIVIIFNGNCAEALLYYEKVFGAKAQVLRYNESPSFYPKANEYHADDLIRMATLEIGGTALRLVDIVDDINLQQTEKIIIMITATVKQAKTLYQKMIASGAEVYVSPAKRFFSDFNAVAIDKFGIIWSFNGGFKI